MAVISATVGSSSIVLSDNNPYGIVSAQGMGGTGINRVTAQGPAQDGDTDLGFRLGVREMELTIGFKAATDALLDAARDTLTSFFKPLTATPISLRVVRDDGEIRQISCNLVGAIQIDLDRTYRPGHYHRATLRLRAPDPAWYKLAPGTATLTGSVAFDANWWLAGGAIDASRVLMHGGTPGLNETWSYAGTIVATDSWTLALRGAYVSSSGTAAQMFDEPTVAITRLPQFGVAGDIPLYRFNGNTYLGSSAMTAGTQVYFMNNSPAGLAVGSASLDTYKTAWVAPAGTFGVNDTTAVIGTAGKWRTGGWSGAVQLYALYTPHLSDGERTAVGAYMAGTSANLSQILIIPYGGDLPEYPIISLTGPLVSPVITNTATGETLDFTGATIGAGTTYVIDTRYGYKTVRQGTVSKVDQLSDDSDLSTWHLAPDPVATGGTNMVAVYGSGGGSATSISLVYYNRFMSY